MALTGGSHHAGDEVDARLVALRQFLAACPFKLRGVRLVRYRGADFLVIDDVALQDLERQVAASVHEGCRVDWLSRNALLYLRVSASDGPAPSWERVFAEQDLADARSMLKEAGWGSDA